MGDAFYNGYSAIDAVTVTPNDSADLTAVEVVGNVVDCRALVIGTAGNVKITTLNGNTRTLTGVPAGVLPVKVSKVWSTDTTATGIIALY